MRWCLVVALVACQGGDADKPKPSPVAPEAAIPEDALGTVEPDASTKVEPEPEPPDPGKLIAELSAIPAWQAVIDRAQLLARRGQHGVVFGTIGPEVAPYVWLVDDTEGNGALGIRVLLGDESAKQGDRVALGGAWMLDDERRWYWKVDALTPLPPGPPTDGKDPPTPVPSHEVQNGNLPQGARTITVARDNDAVYFQLVGPPPVRDGDGWLVADELGDVPFARLQLPGERPAYGGQDMRAADERWHLKRAQTYWVRIGKIRRSTKPDEPANINARTAPVRVN
ncbi:MAG TPA: hypothetical protein VK427_19435 [Kofleriaceae bacterium]|nr:hypothetical protein [Kofleriaceae bacterium]